MGRFFPEKWNPSGVMVYEYFFPTKILPLQGSIDRFLLISFYKFENIIKSVSKRFLYILRTSSKIRERQGPAIKHIPFRIISGTYGSCFPERIPISQIHANSFNNTCEFLQSQYSNWKKRFRTGIFGLLRVILMKYNRDTETPG